MRPSVHPSTLFGGLALCACTVCFALGGADGRTAGVLLGLVGLSWLLPPPAGTYDGDDW